MDLMAIDHKIEKISYKLFRAWTKKAKKKYPDIDFTIRDEQVLGFDLRHSIESALSSLYNSAKEKEFYKAFLWDVGFVLGFIQGNLNSHWFNEYIAKRSEVYKQIMVLSAIKKILEYEELYGIQIAHMYRELINADVNLKEYDYKLPHICFDVKKRKVNNSTEDVENGSLISACIEKIRVEKILTYVKCESPMFMPDLKTNFTTKQIQKIIYANRPVEMLRKQGMVAF